MTAYRAVALLAWICLSIVHGKSPQNILGQNVTVTEEAWFKVEIKDHGGPGEDYVGTFVIALFGEVVPMTVLSFESITKGYRRKQEYLHYKHTPIHRIVRDFIVQMGDVTVKDGTGGKSIYGPSFVDENFLLSHQAAGYVAMANRGANTNGSQFFITLAKLRWLDNKHVVFGKVIKGMDLIRTIGEEETSKTSGFPKRKITIIDCGLVGKKKYEMTPEQQQSEEDLQ